MIILACFFCEYFSVNVVDHVKLFVRRCWHTYELVVNIIAYVKCFISSLRRREDSVYSLIWLFSSCIIECLHIYGFFMSGHLSVCYQRIKEKRDSNSWFISLFTLFSGIIVTMQREFEHRYCIFLFLFEFIALGVDDCIRDVSCTAIADNVLIWCAARISFSHNVLYMFYWLYRRQRRGVPRRGGRWYRSFRLFSA